MTVHELKTWSEYFAAVRNGSKKFEVRKNDRDFKQGDELQLNEFDPNTGEFTTWTIRKRVMYILHGPAFGIEEGYCVMSLGEANN